MISLPKILFLLAAFATLAPANSYAEPEQSNAEQVDFTALLTRTDEIDVCVNTFRQNQDRTCSEVFYKIHEAKCTCARDLTRSFFNQVEIENPTIINIGVQLTLNKETYRIIFEESESAFFEYTEHQMPLDLNISSEELDTAITKTGVRSAEYTYSSWLKQHAYKMDIPSCASMQMLHEEHFPLLGKVPGLPMNAERKFCEPN